MKTTIEMPDEIFRAAKATALMRGTTLKELVTDAVKRSISTAEVAAVSHDEFISRWEQLAKENAAAWKSPKTTLKQLAEDRNARGY